MTAVEIAREQAAGDYTKVISTTVFYVGYAKRGITNTAAPGWAIKKVAISNGGTVPYDIAITWANGITNPEASSLIMDDYAGYDYTIKIS